MKQFGLLILFVLVLFSGKAQNDSGFIGAVDCYPKTFSIQVYITEDKESNVNVTETDILAAVSDASIYFDPICVGFSICDIDTLKNTDHDTIIMGTDDRQITSIYHRKNTINLYVVESVMGGNCGETTLGDTSTFPISNDRDAIFIPKGCLTDQQSLARLLGKYFGLLPTYHNADELVDGSNCQTAGDRFCDTPADRQVVTSLITDANGDYYAPHWGNLMRFVAVGDEYHFSPEQLNRMVAVMKTGRNYLW